MVLDLSKVGLGWIFRGKEEGGEDTSATVPKQHSLWLRTWGQSTRVQ